ncbi:MAG TPA: NAD(P)-binding domain-containing protein [Verrucomicrobiae bacterium]|jgi:thioredoxin reductase (NADPH)|nr:NAD(P)-binding domain-containing protein [Verrucomicrobiae bacterium]
MDTLIAVIIALPVALFFVRRYLRHLRQNEERARRMIEMQHSQSDTPRVLRPQIDAARCIGCSSCTTVCPEGDVLAMARGKAVIANLQRCIGHERCAEACPMGAITMVKDAFMDPSTPRLTDEYETTIENLFIVGELGGLPLIRNAVNQGRQCIDIIAKRISRKRLAASIAGIYDVLIVGAGPAGISASLRAIEHKLSYITIEADEVGGTVAKFPRHKIVTTTPLEFPMFGKFDRTELPKEHLLAFWDMILNRADFNVCADSRVLDIRKTLPGVFCVMTATRKYWARTIVLATGRAGNPRKLGVPGEHLAKVMYRLMEAEHYRDKNILIIGGGDSAIEAAVALSHQPGNKVTISYRRQEFTRIKQRNAQLISEGVRRGTIDVIFNSTPVEFKNDSVVLRAEGTLQTLENDFVWIFAGGAPPHEFLNKIGVGCGAPASEIISAAEDLHR